MVSRRDFLAAPLVTATAAMFLRAVIRPRGVKPGNVKSGGVKLGCQTNAWRIDPDNFDSLLEVLRRIKELGFDGFETGFRNVQGRFANAAAARAQIETTGLRFLGCHIFLDQYNPQTRIAPQELIQTVAEGAASLGAERLILSGGGLTQNGQVSQVIRMDLKNKVDGMN